jgi:hypothetical protein
MGQLNQLQKEYIMNVKFTVAMNAEEKKAGNVQTINLDVSFEGVDESLIYKHALANCVVGWQSQIRSHWDEYVDGKLPESITFGDPLFESARKPKARKMTMDEMVTHIKSLPEDEQADWIDKLVQ